MTEKKPSVLFKTIKWLVKVFYPKTSAVGSENLPDEVLDRPQETIEQDIP